MTSKFTTQGEIGKAGQSDGGQKDGEGEELRQIFVQREYKIP